MAYDGWMEFNGQEFINVARTARLARAIGLDTVRIREELVATLEGITIGSGFGTGMFGFGPFGEAADSTFYSDITLAPWYDAGVPASMEFAGIVPLSFRGLDDSTLTREVTEYVTDGGNTGRARNATLPIVASVALVATTERGAEYGKRWMDRVLRNTGSASFCRGADLYYFRYLGDDAPLVHRRDVSLTRGSSITRKKISACSSTWLATFTLTAGDSYEYGQALDQVDDLGGTVEGEGLATSGSLTLTQVDCPVYDYTPIYDPLHPALIPSPTAPDFLPAGWAIDAGMSFTRYWARLNPVEPSDFFLVPKVVLSTATEARMVRIGVWSSDADPSDQCGPLWSVVVSYLPPDLNFYIDGEQQASYAWDGTTPVVRRTDSLTYSPDARPVQWAAFNDSVGLMVTLDLFADSSGIEGDGDVRMALSLIPKSD